MNKPTLVVLAAGMGSRFGGLKQITPVDPQGDTILHFSLFDACRAGFGKVVFIIKHSIDEEFRRITAGVERHMEVAYVYQELDMLPEGFSVPEGRTKPWGTAHAVLCAAEAIGDSPFAVVNADDFYGAGAFETMARYFAEPHDENEYAMVGYLLKNAMTENGSVARGVCEVENGFLRSLTERTHIEKRGEDAVYTEDGEHFFPLSGNTVVSMNLFGYRASFLRRLRTEFPEFLRKQLCSNPTKGEFYLSTVTDRLIEQGLCRLRVLHTDESWYGVTYHDDLPQVQSAIAEMHRVGKYPEILFR